MYRPGEVYWFLQYINVNSFIKYIAECILKKKTKALQQYAIYIIESYLIVVMWPQVADGCSATNFHKFNGLSPYIDVKHSDALARSEIDAFHPGQFVSNFRFARVLYAQHQNRQWATQIRQLNKTHNIPFHKIQQRNKTTKNDEEFKKKKDPPAPVNFIPFDLPRLRFAAKAIAHFHSRC